MHVAIIVLDSLIIVAALALARMLRLWFFYVALLCFGVTVLTGLHYGLNYPWTFVGKYAINVAILVMAWAGNHLAAKSSDTDTEKRLWRALFIAITVIALGGSFWVLSDEDAEHKKELGEQRENIVGDVMRGFMRYNETHPQYALPTERSSRTATRATNDKQAVDDPYQFLRNKALISNGELVAAANVTAGEIDNLMGEWRQEISGEIEPRRNQEIYERDPPLPENERNRLDNDFQKQSDAADKQYGSRVGVLLSRAEGLRKALVERLFDKSSSPLPADSKIDDLSKRLAASGANSSYDVGPGEISAQLRHLSKRLK